MPFEFYDLDKQGGTIHKTCENPNALVTLVDTPGGIFADSPKWIGVADVVILPVRPSSRDLEPFLRMAKLIKENLKKDAIPVFVLNMMNHRFKATKDFLEWINKAYKEKRPPFDGNFEFSILASSEMSIQAAAAGKSIIDFAPKSEIANHVRMLNDKIFNLLGVENG